MNFKETVKQVLIRQMNKKYYRELKRKSVSYDTWVREREATEKDRVSRIAEERAGRAYVLFLQAKGELSNLAYDWLDEMFASHPEAVIVYGDEDLETKEGIRENPWFKPCWSPDLCLSGFFLGSVIAVRKEYVEKCVEDARIIFEKPEEIRPVLRTFLEKAGGFSKGCKSILHCPHVLFHVEDSQIWERYLDSREEDMTFMENDFLQEVSVIIPSKDNPEILGKCLHSLEQIQGLDIVVVDNGSNSDNQELIKKLTEGMTYLYHPMEFNFSKMCNMGAAAAKKRYLLFLNDDIEVYGTEWLTAMQRKAARPYVGAVGLKLYYPDSVRIQHAGIISLPVGPVHKMQFAQDDRRIYFDRNRGEVNCLAVTGACLMIDREKFEEVGGFKESLPVAYNDVELGFALYEAGYHNVVLNQYFAYHHESFTRGNDTSKEKLARLQQERKHLYALHPAFRKEDPYYPEGLSRDGLDSRIVPAYHHARNILQYAALERVEWAEGQVREDPCLFLGLELSDADQIRGYGVVLGDNNACYDRFVILKNEVGEMYQVPAEPQYRQDLEENMADQENVALCGFHLCFSQETLKEMKPKGPWQVGVMAVHKMNKGKLINWSGRYFGEEFR